jgi:hypothetical protein
MSLYRALLPFLAALAGCGGTDSPTDAGGTCDPAMYPCGPYGLARGSVIADLALQAKRDANRSGTAVDDPVTTVHLADYYADAKLSALVVVIGTETCVPCQNEQPTLLDVYNHYQPGGAVAFLEAIVQGQAGMPADTQVVDAWATRYQLPFDMTADPTGALAPYYNASAFPAAMVIAVREMRIVYAVNGPVDNLMQIIDPLL